MDARLTEEQALLRETAEQVARALAPESPGSLDPGAESARGWQTLADVGLLGMRLPEEAGGEPTSGVEVALVGAELGRFLVPLPFLGSAVCASELLVAAGAESSLLARLAKGELRLAPILDRGLGRLARVGEPGVAWDAAGAAAGLALDAAGRRLIALELDAACPSADLTRVFRRVAPDAAAATPDRLGGALGGVLDDPGRARFEGLAMTGVAADLLGIMEGALEESVDYVAQREQFGTAVGAFQAVQHIAAEAKVSLEATRSAVAHAAWAVDRLPPGEALLAARVAKACAARESRRVTESALQMHGGVGFTWEHMTHVRVRRALLSRESFGDERAQLSAIAQLRIGRSIR